MKQVTKKQSNVLSVASGRQRNNNIRALSRTSFVLSESHRSHRSDLSVGGAMSCRSNLSR